MKIKPYSRILAGAYVGWGLIIFLIMPYLVSLLSEMGGTAPMPAFTRAVFKVGPSGWLLLTLVVGTLVILKDLRFPSRILNVIFTAFLVLLVSGVTFAVGVWVESQFDTVSD